MNSDADHATSTALSRRALLSFLASSPLILASCRSLGSADAPSASFGDAQIDRVMDSYNALARSHPSLPGIRSLAQVNERLAGGLSPADLSLLAAALSLKASEQVARIRRPITMTDVRSVLSRPIDMAPYGRSFIERTLAEARAGEATNPTRPQERRRCTCLWGTPCWICAAMALILIIAIIAVLVAL